MRGRNILIAGIIALFAIACGEKKVDRLPILGQKDPVTKNVDGKEVTDTVYQTIPAFKFVNQYGDSISDANLKGNIYVADFFFTSCPSICPTMHRNMLNVYNAYKADENFKILSFSIDPKYDSVPVLKKYADKLGIAGQSWWLLQGGKDETYKLANSFLTSVAEDASVPGGHVHDGWFVLIDKQKRIRGTYNGVDEVEVKKLIADIKVLQAEPEQSVAQ